jgi:hypothetical protein
MYFTAGDKEYQLKYTMKSVKALERKTGKPFQRIMAEDNLGFIEMGLFIWAGLLHQNPILTEAQTDDIIQKFLETNEDEDITVLIEKASKAFEESGFGAKKKKKIIQEIQEEVQEESQAED